MVGMATLLVVIRISVEASGVEIGQEPAQGGGAGILTVKLNLPRLGRKRHAQRLS